MIIWRGAMNGDRGGLARDGFSTCSKFKSKFKLKNVGSKMLRKDGARKLAKQRGAIMKHVKGSGTMTGGIKCSVLACA